MHVSFWYLIKTERSTFALILPFASLFALVSFQGHSVRQRASPVEKHFSNTVQWPHWLILVLVHTASRGTDKISSAVMRCKYRNNKYAEPLLLTIPADLVAHTGFVQITGIAKVTPNFPRGTPS